LTSGTPSAGRERLGLRFFFDTNFIGDASPDAEQLRRYHRDGWINLQRTDTVDTELAGTQEPGHRERLLAESGGYIESLGPGVLDHSRLDRAVLGTERDQQCLDRMLAILAPDTNPAASTGGRAKRKVRDAMHLCTAIRYGGTGFITRDQRDILRRAAAIAAAFDDFRVLTPEQAVVLTERFLRRWRFRNKG
jgi:hypothetical protein